MLNGRSALVWFALGLSPAALAVDAQTSLRTQAAFSENPNNQDLYGADSEASSRFLFRQSVLAKPSDAWTLEFNAYNLLAGSSDQGSIGDVIASSTDERNRSAKLERHWQDSHRLDGYLTVDRLSARERLGALDATVGRFPINMAAMAIFTPNDFFAPFRAQTFYREYKPGVDAARADLGLGQSGQLSVMGVAGYVTESPLGRAGGADGNRFAYEESSAIARGAATLAGWQVALLGGKLGPYDMAGFTVQGEVGAFGVKAEGHQKKHRLRPVSSAEVAAGVDFRPTDKVLLQLEGFSHGSGYATADDYAQFEDDPDRPLYFLGREYGALAAAWDVTPLLVWKNLVVGNFTDDSALVSSNLAYSVAENAEVSATYTLPRGKGPQGKALRSEFGAAPRTLALETALYF